MTAGKSLIRHERGGRREFFWKGGTERMHRRQSNVVYEQGQTKWIRMLFRQEGRRRPDTQSRMAHAVVARRGLAA